MKISLNWLRDYVALPESVSALTETLTLAGVEVEEVITHGVDLPQVVVAKILSSEPHPDADRLSVCQVDDGSAEPRQIVCGAKNYQVGDKVPLALPGAVLPGNFKIKVGKLRGVKSEGMMAAAEELGLPKGEDGLLILPADATVGAPLSEIFPTETVLDLEITPNRPDLLGHIGLAREVAALTGAALLPAAGLPSGARPSGTAVAIESPLCSHYSLRVLNDLKIGPSPDWLKRKLEALGLRAINAVVDVTNLVLFETGQPLHAFDADTLKGEIRVRPAEEGEKFVALDESTHVLRAGDLIIADASGPLALAGVMGGRESGVTESTKNILLESASFDSAAVRRSSRELGLASDSSHRFERGIDPAGVLPASERAAQLILELAGGREGELRWGGGDFEPAPPRTLTLRPQRLQALLGVEVPADRVDAILTGFGLNKTEAGWEIPSFRADLSREVDLIEEVARVIGMDAIPSRVLAIPATPGKADARYDFHMSLRRKLCAQGMSEARTSALVADGGGCEEALRLRNPLGEDQTFLRTSLVPGLLSTLSYNIRQGASRVALFELGRTFHAGKPEESTSLAILLYGNATAKNWRGESPRSLDWHDARGMLESVVGEPLQFVSGEASAPFALFAEVRSATTTLGVIGQLAPAEARKRDASGPVLAAELSLESLRTHSAVSAYQEICRFPAVGRDFAILCPKELPYADIEKNLRETGEALLAEVQLFDVFTDPSGEKVPEDRKSLAISLTFRTGERTLNSEEVNAACERLKQNLIAKLAVEFR